MTTEMIEQILSKENLEEAKCKVMSNKGSAGVDRMKTSELPKFIEAHGEELCEAIRRRRTSRSGNAVTTNEIQTLTRKTCRNPKRGWKQEKPGSAGS